MAITDKLKVSNDPIARLREIDEQLDAAYADLNKERQRPLDPQELRAAYDAELNDQFCAAARKFFGSELEQSELSGYKGLWHHLFGMQPNNVYQILIGSMVIATEPGGRDRLFEAFTSHIVNFVSLPEKKKRIDAILVRIEKLERERERICQAMEEAGGIPDRRPDTEPRFLVLRADDTIDEDRFRRIRGLSSMAAAAIRSARDRLGVLRDRRTDLSRLVENYSNPRATDSQQRESTEAKSLIKKIDEQIAKTNLEIQQSEEVWRRRNAVASNAENFIREKGIDIRNIF